MTPTFFHNQILNSANHKSTVVGFVNEGDRLELGRKATRLFIAFDSLLLQHKVLEERVVDEFRFLCFGAFAGTLESVEGFGMDDLHGRRECHGVDDHVLLSAGLFALRHLCSCDVTSSSVT